VNSSPPIGAIAFGKSGAGYPVIEVRPDRIVLKRADGPWAVSPMAIVRWELPAPRPIQPGDRVRLKGTQAEYVVIELYQHFMGLEDGDRTYETWAWLTTADGKPARWKMQQLEVI
jgi:D-serine deaminase-like pyridoxal phosphate-dependent protein